MGKKTPEQLLQLIGNRSQRDTPPAALSQKPRKRKPSKPLDEQQPAKKARPHEPERNPPATSLGKPHEGVIGELSAKHDVLGASVISSTKIQKRVVYICQHLLREGGDKPCIGLLYARPGDVCKLTTVVEQCKRVLKEEGKRWYQYNQLFDLPPEEIKKNQTGAQVVEETRLEDEEDSDSEDDYFESIERIEKAVLPRPQERAVKSLRVFLSLEPVHELRTRPGVTTQTSE
ncbi:hypothetical protein N3K66_004643 [Trichothecium roseum]|uniref:Uncharacterized protein n=1 Tax=Trichothecium roseum TaxID=47278 RepID=A0ACC0V4K5_9HYPO|nr:hypothetical protein N3K66_004643 [Trichothecium roseum]